MNRITEEVIKEECISYILPPMTFLSKILKASRKSTIVGDGEASSLRRSRERREGLIEKRSSVKLAGKKKARVFFKAPKENPEENFVIEPWFDDQLFSRRL